MAQHNKTGEWGEALAREYLVSKGYAIIDTNARFGKNELDIIAEHNNRIVFVEVKTRSSEDYDPVDAIDLKKIKHLCRGAEAYVRSFNIPHPVQFDVIVVIGTPETAHRIEHYADAFMPPMSGI